MYIGKIIANINTRRREREARIKELEVMERELRLSKSSQEYYEQCLSRARAGIPTWMIPVDPDGTLREELRRVYLGCITDAQFYDDYILDHSIQEYDSLKKNTHFVIFFIVILLSILTGIIISFYNRPAGIGILIAVIVIFICVKLGNELDKKEKLEIAAECKFACEVLDARKDAEDELKVDTKSKDNENYEDYDEYTETAFTGYTDT